MSRGLFGNIAGGIAKANGVRADAEFQDAGGGFIIDLKNPEHVEYLRNGGFAGASGSGRAMRIGAVWRCVHLLSGVPGNMPLDLVRQVSESEVQPAEGHASRQLVTTSPNGWQTPQDFKRMLTAHVALRGNGYGLKITSMGRVIEVWPMHPDRVQPLQLPDMSVVYDYIRNDGSPVRLQQSEVLHVRGLSLDGVKGLGVLEYARTTMGLALQSQETAARLFKQGTITPGALKSPNPLSDIAYNRLRESLDNTNAGAENAHKWLILEEGLDVASIGLSAVDLQFLEERKFDRADIAMFFGVPLFLLGDTEKSTSWGTGLEQQINGFIAFTAEDYLTAWEQACRRDLLTKSEAASLFFKFDRAALARGDLKARTAAYASALQWGWMNPDQVRRREGLNPREDGEGGKYYDPPNTAGDTSGAGPEPTPKED